MQLIDCKNTMNILQNKYRDFCSKSKPLMFYLGKPHTWMNTVNRGTEYFRNKVAIQVFKVGFK